MRKFITAAIALLLASSPSFAQDNDQVKTMADPAVSEWVMAESVKQAAQIRDTLIRGTSVESPGLYVYSLEEYPAPAAVKESIRKGIEKRRQGVIEVAPGQIPSSSKTLSSFNPAQSQNPDRFRQRLTSSPTDLSRTALASAELISSEPGGQIQDGRATGMTRIYNVPNFGVVSFGEDDYLSAKSRIIQVKEALNSEVNGVPAIAYAEKTSDNRGRATLSWVTSMRSYRLVMLTDSDRLRAGQKLLMDIATHIVE